MSTYQKEKLCPDCGRVLPRSAFYSKGKSKMDGKAYLTTRCKECHRAWRKTNRAAETEAMRQWRAKNRDAWNAYMRAWRAKHPNRDEHRCQAYRQFNSKRGRGRVEREAWVAIIEAFGGVCAYCGSDEPLEVDHFVPISLGGDQSLDNFIPACRSCNAIKSNKHPREFLSPADYDRVVNVLSSL